MVGTLRERLLLGRLLHGREGEDLRGAGRSAGHDRRGGRCAHGEHVFDEVSAHAGEEEAAQERVDAELAWAADLDQELDDAGAQLAQIARELVGASEVFVLAAAGEDFEAELREQVGDLVEARADLGGGAVGVEARAGDTVGQHRAYRRGDFRLGQRGGVLRESGDGVELGEEDVDGQRDAESLRKQAQALVHGLAERADLLGGAGREDALNADAEQDSPGGLQGVLGKRRAELAGRGEAHQALPQAGLAQQSAAGFHDGGVSGQPDVDHRRGHDGLVAVDLSGEQLGIEAGLQDGLRLSGVLVADDVDQGHRRERLYAGAVGLLELGVGVTDERVQHALIGAVGGFHRSGRHLFEVPDRKRGCHDAEQDQHDVEQEEPLAFQVQQVAQADDQADVHKQTNNDDPDALLHRFTPSAGITDVPSDAV